MSEVNDNQGPANAGGAAPHVAAPVPMPYGPETRHERWMKYGLNVVLVSLLVVVLAALVVWAAQANITFRGKTYSFRARGDLTSGGSYSLKPQTVTVISELKSPVKVVSLYPRLKQEPGTPPEQRQQDFYQAVDDILQEYARKGKNIEVESIDPVAEPAKLDKWLADVIKRYGGNVKNYRDLLEQFPKTLGEINKLASAEVEKMTKLPEMQFKDDRQAETMYAAFNTVRGFPRILELINQNIQQELEQKIPDYKGQVKNVENLLTTFSRQLDAVHKRMEELQKSDAAPQAAKDYAKGSLPDFDAMKKQADDVLAKIKGLGELKLDEVRQRLVAPEGETPPPAIAVMGENDIKLIDFKDVWKSGESTGLMQASAGTAPKFRFAGEQQLTAAMLSLSQPKKTKVAFVRGGGPAKTTAGMMGQGGDGSCTEIAQRLRSYNFEVLEKDVSGQSAQRAMMGGMPPAGEPSDEDIKDAIWVVFSEPQMTQFGPMPGGSPELATKLKEHLDRGGSAIVLFELNGDSLASVLGPWGINVRPNMVAVHEPVVVPGARSDDFIEDARRQPPIFVLNDYGGPHPITDTLQALDAALVPMLPVEVNGAPGVEVTRLLPVPTEPQSWAEADVGSVTRPNGRPTFDPKSGDVAGPLYAGAAAQMKDKGRLVVIGCARFPYNFLITLPDQKVFDRTGREVARFPGNGELFTNSIFWLARMDKMIALSPSALDTPRIRPMSTGMLAFWRIGVLLIGLPLLAVVSGLLVWQARRD